MNEPDFWTNCAEAMELTTEGNRLIVREISEIVRDAWHGMAEAMTNRFRTRIHGRQSPPV